MQLSVSSVLVLLAAAAVSDTKPTPASDKVEVEIPATNAQRLARGMPLLKPRKFYDPTRAGARRSEPSTTPGQCNTGSIQCCQSLTTAGDSALTYILALLGLHLSPNVPIGQTCSPLNLLGLGGSSCNQQPVCCQNNSFNGIIAIGCVPIS